MTKLQFLFCRFSTLWYHPTGNQTRPASISGVVFAQNFENHKKLDTACG